MIRTPPSMETYGPWAIVVGGSEGLGAAFAEALGHRGFNLVLVARRQDVLLSRARKLERSCGVSVQPIVADLATSGTAEHIVTETSDLDVGLLVYNAAYSPIGPFCDIAPDSLAKVVNVNIRGPLSLIHGLLPQLRQRAESGESPGRRDRHSRRPHGRRGGIILMSSLSGSQGAPLIAAYSASKSFNSILAQSLWHELRTDGVDVVGCCAGAVRTPGYTTAAGHSRGKSRGRTDFAISRGRASRGRDAPGTLDASTVAEAALKGLGRKPLVVPGMVNKIARFVMTRLLPVRTAVRLMAASTRDLGR